MTSSFPSTLPDWVIIDRYVFKDNFPTGEPTEASCTNSRGDEFRVCFQLHEPPRPSRFCLSWPAGTGKMDRIFVVSAHRDAVLLQMMYPVPVHGCEIDPDMYDYFLYTAGGGGGGAGAGAGDTDSSRRPSLERFPSIDGTMSEFQDLFRAGQIKYTLQGLRRIECLDIGVVRRGNESALAELQVDRFAPVPVELHVLRPSHSSRWQVRYPEINLGDSELNLEDLVSSWSSDIVVAIGRFLCWVDYCVGGILLFDVFCASSQSQLQYIPFPAKLPNLDREVHGGGTAELYQAVCTNEEHNVIKFFLVDQPDGQIVDEMQKPAPDFKVTSWTLKVTEASISWVVDSVLKSDDLWKLDGFAQQLPHKPLEYPLVSMANPSITYFVLKQQEKGREESGFRYDDTWSVAIDMPNMTVISSCQYINGKEEGLPPEDVKYIKSRYRYFEPLLPSEFPKYLKLQCGSSGHKQGQAGHSDFCMAVSLLVKRKYAGA